MSALPMLAQATEVASEPNWVLIGSIVGAFVILAIVLMFASKKRLGADKTPDKTRVVRKTQARKRLKIKSSCL